MKPSGVLSGIGACCRYFDTLMSCSAASTSSELAASELAAAGISPGMVRMSVGLTGSLSQRWRQLESALERLPPLTLPPGDSAGGEAPAKRRRSRDGPEL